LAHYGQLRMLAGCGGWVFLSKEFEQKRVLLLRAMAVGGTHRDFEASAAEWARARDVLAGEDAVSDAERALDAAPLRHT
jgi:hypothetical protein